MYITYLSCQILTKLTFLDKYSKKFQMSNSMKIYLAGAELLYTDRDLDTRADGRTDRNDEANGRFSQFFESAWSGSTIKKFCTRHVGFIIVMWLIELYQLTGVINKDVM